MKGLFAECCLEVHIGCASWSLGRCLDRGGGYVGQQVGKCVQSFVPSLNSPLFPKPPSERGSSSLEEGHVRSASVSSSEIIRIVTLYLIGGRVSIFIYPSCTLHMLVTSFWEEISVLLRQTNKKCC